MPIVFGTGNKLGDYNGYFTNSLNQEGAGASGSTMANKFLQDMKAGRDCLDIVIVGDSNAGNGDRGWFYGWEKALLTAGVAPYATCLVPCMHTSAANTRGGMYSGLLLTNNTDRAVGQSGGQAWLATGSANGGAANTFVSTVWGNVNGDLWTWGTSLDWAYVAAGSDQKASFGTDMASASPFNVKSNFKFRVGYVTFPFGSGSFSLACYSNTAAALVSSGTWQTADTDYSLKTATLDVPADAARTGTIRFFKYSGFTAAQGATGPVGFLFESIYRKGVKGSAVNMLHYYGGRQTGQTAATLSTNINTVKTYLKELRERQIDAGGTGRVLVFTTLGINDVAAGQIGNYGANMNQLIGTFNKAWAELKFPISDLAFAVTVTHPTVSDDANQATARAQAKSSVAFGAGGQVAFVDLNQATSYNYLNSNSYYAQDGFNNAHLTEAGYGASADILLAALLK
ncbi:hypothetical protein UFOVP403_23 [uncultured Caudovirales phage]|uniref:Uncharacterized protein n=1 Tax=uncultured Caudovirales phage TaxID=2100421 RepID=A0A6J5M2C8_9CAUD|nr:hypothetical protein UFOVP403_23 [uncultured Caudovirales phage]